MILSFGDGATEDLFHGKASKRAARFANIEAVACRKLDMLNAANSLHDLAASPGNHLEPLKRELKGFYSIRVNDQWRIVFMWEKGNASAVRITDYH